jgi:PAS domain S-box-containing protein
LSGNRERETFWENTETIKVLHLDDDSVDHILLSKNIKKIEPNIELVWFASGEKAAEEIEKTGYDCIICDFQMPDMDGMEFLMLIREKHLEIPFIFYTGQGNEQVAAEAFRSGADDYYSKDEGFAQYQRIAASIYKNVRAYRNSQNYQYAVKALKKSDERLTLAGKALYDVMYDWDLRTNKIYWFNKFEESLGYSEGEIDTSIDGWAKLLHPEDRERILPLLEKDKQEGKILAYEYRMRAKDGSYRFWQERGYPQKDVNGKIVRWIGVCRDITEKKDLEEKLQYNLDVLEKAQEMAHMGSYSLDFNTGLWECSEVLDEIFGIDSSFPRNIEAWISLIHPDDKEKTADHLQNHVMAKGNPFDAEYRIVRPDNGKTTWVHGVGKVYRNDSGEPMTMIGAIRDITTSKITETNLLAQNEKLLKLLDSMPVLADAFDKDGNILYWNKECERVTGYSSEEICNNPKALELLYPDNEYRQYVMNTIEQSKYDFINLEFKLTAKDGKEKTVSWSNVSSKNPIQGWHTWAVGVEKTEIETSQKMVAELQNCMEQAERLVKVGSWTWDFGTLENHWSPGMYSITEREEKLGPTKTVEEWLELIHPEDRLRIMNKFDRLHNERSTEFDDDFRLVTPSGKIKHISMKGNTIIEDNNLAKVYGAIVDVTSRQEAEDALQLALDKLKRSNADLKAFSYTVSHDLRAPLRRIKGFVELLHAEYIETTDENVEMIIDNIVKSCFRMNELIDSIINLAMAQKKELHLDEFDLGHLALDAIRKLKEQEPHRKVKFSCKDVLLTKADKALIKILINNLISNAWKYSSNQEAAVITMGRDRINDVDYFFVEDNGVGMDIEKADEAFQPFTRLRSELNVEGSGIGLATAKRIIEAHGGDIFIQSEPGKGTAIYFKI